MFIATPLTISIKLGRSEIFYSRRMDAGTFRSYGAREFSNERSINISSLRDWLTLPHRFANAASPKSPW